MEPDPYSVKADEPLDDVVLTFEKYDLAVMPVVDGIGRLVGRITFDDVMDEAREQTERDYQLASGLSTDVETDDKILDQAKARLPWLIIGMIGGLSNSWILGNFEGNLPTIPPSRFSSRLSAALAETWESNRRQSLYRDLPTARSTLGSRCRRLSRSLDLR